MITKKKIIKYPWSTTKTTTRGGEKNEKGGINRPPGVFDIRYVPCPWHWLSPSTDLRRGSSLPADH